MIIKMIAKTIHTDNSHKQLTPKTLIRQHGAKKPPKKNKQKTPKKPPHTEDTRYQKFMDDHIYQVSPPTDN